jgi:hypothetical protein
MASSGFPRLSPNDDERGREITASRAAADKIADSINRYWAERGYDAQARAVETRLIDRHGSTEEFTVVSNLRNGVPSRAASDEPNPEKGS